ncbi:N-6 DNA methylase [Nocardiopsis mangrovi]|uniref:N-6 DNA methylase n=1 Tax=Nocardiopsis mangrovi TaxID=1179818 RepID=A0ABV9DXL4_9ACTN
MSQQVSVLVTAADISRLAGVTRATVSNWRRRHSDFPAPVGGTDTSPTYDLNAVRAWLADRGQLPEDSPADKLRTDVLHLEAGSGKTFLISTVLAAALLSRRRLDALPELPDDELLLWGRSARGDVGEDVPGGDEADLDDAESAELLRTVLRAVIAEGPETTAAILARRLVEDSGASGTYTTPAPLARLMAELLRDRADAPLGTVLDPACGSGSLLVEAAGAGARKLFGQDILTGQAAHAAVRLRLTAPKAKTTVRSGDSLRSDAFPDLEADAVLCNPPYGVRNWGHDELAYDERWAYGVPPKGEPELAWVQHCLSHLAPGGRAVLLLPPAVAERAGARRIRTQLLRDSILRALVALPPGAAPPLHIGLHLWVLERPGTQGHVPENVLFVDAANDVVADGRGPDWVGLRQTVLSAWREYGQASDDFTGVPGTAQVVPLIDLLTEVADLTPARHVRTVRNSASPEQQARNGKRSLNLVYREASELIRVTEHATWPPSGEQPREWRTATVADLLRGGALTLLHASHPGRRTRSGESRRTEHVRPHPAPESAQRLVLLTANDVLEGRLASGTKTYFSPDGLPPMIKKADVLLPEVLRGGAPLVARVAQPEEASCYLGPELLLFRPDQRRLDPWFLAGFLAEEQNINAAVTGTSIVRVEPRRLRVPLLPLAEQRRYGEAFRRLYDLHAAARRTAHAAEESTRILKAGLTGGALLPPRHEKM